jgi:hypothetical protein
VLGSADDPNVTTRLPRHRQARTAIPAQTWRTVDI